MLKIAISGTAGVGKNTIATIIANDILKLEKDEYCISAFAKRLKLTIKDLFPGCDEQALYGDSELRQKYIRSDLDKEIEDLAVTFRQASIDIGKLCRIYSPKFWVAHTSLEFYRLPEKIKLYIIADVRFIEEYEWLKNNGFFLIRVKRNTSFKINDVSETEQKLIKDNQFDLIIDNNVSIEELRENIRISLGKLLSNKKILY